MVMKRSAVDVFLAYLRLLRPVHWFKNVLLFVPIFFGKQLFHIPTLSLGVKGFFLFSCVASGIYILNDFHDRNRDKYHPQKALRPIASGLVSPGTAVVISLILIITGTALGFVINRQFGLILIVYSIINEAYSLKLKHITLLDVFCVALGYFLRILGGSAISGIEVSRWLFLTSFFVALFISLGKRLGELNLYSDISHRPALKSYSSYYIIAVSAVSASASLVTFGLYCIEKGTFPVYTTILAAYGLFRYLLLVMNREGSEPIQLFIKDVQLQLVTLIFILVMGWAIY